MRDDSTYILQLLLKVNYLLYYDLVQKNSYNKLTYSVIRRHFDLNNRGRSNARKLYNARKPVHILLFNAQINNRSCVFQFKQN